MIWWFALVFLAGIVLGTISMAMLTMGSVQDDVMEHANRYMQSEEFMQRLYYIGLEVQNEDREERLEAYRKILGCEWCDKRVQKTKRT